jgi:hypothetical protein
LGNSTIEFVWVPIFEPTKMPETDTIWAANMPLPVNVNMTFNMSKKGITPSLENSEFFFKYSLLSSAIDFEIMGGYTWDDDPTLHTSQTIVNSTPQLTVSPEHHRLGVLGGSFGKDIAGIFVLRGEIAYYYQKYFLLNNIDTLTNENTDQRDYIHYLIGIDATPFWEITMSIQFIQRAILNYDDNIKDNQFDNTMTFLLRKLFLRDTLTVELFAYYGITNEDALIKPKIAYKFTDELELSIGAYIFVGNNDGLFGQYKDNNMAYIKAKLSF